MSKARDLADSYTDSEIDSLDDLLAPKADPSFTGTPTINGSNAVSNTTLRTELNATGSAPIYACRAWVNFNGTGTVAIRASGNVSSITDNGTGTYTVNFATAFPDLNHAIFTSNFITSTSTYYDWLHVSQSDGRSTTSQKLRFRYLSTPKDAAYVEMLVIR